jgi:hypothetical protein
MGAKSNEADSDGHFLFARRLCGDVRRGAAWHPWLDAAGQSAGLSHQPVLVAIGALGHRTCGRAHRPRLRHRLVQCGHPGPVRHGARTGPSGVTRPAIRPPHPGRLDWMRRGADDGDGREERGAEEQGNLQRPVRDEPRFETLRDRPEISPWSLSGKKDPCRISHWMVWVPSPRLATRLPNIRSESSTSLPFFSQDRTCKKNHSKNSG